MQIFGKSLKEYLKASAIFLSIVFVITLIHRALFISKTLPLGSIYLNLIDYLKMFLIGWAGWSVVRKYDFKLKHVFVIGCLFFILTIAWTLPLLSEIFTFYGLIWIGILNFVVVTLIVLFGGWLAKKISKK
ncbi:MAG: hypothetical protein ACP5IX_03415 [Patescibacteria group bacterium]